MAPQMKRPPSIRWRLVLLALIWGARMGSVALWLSGGLWLLWTLQVVYAPAPGLASYAMLAVGGLFVGLGAALGLQYAWWWGGVGLAGLASVVLGSGLLWLAQLAPVMVQTLPVVFLLAFILYGMVQGRRRERWRGDEARQGLGQGWALQDPGAGGPNPGPVKGSSLPCCCSVATVAHSLKEVYDEPVPQDVP